ncbi:LOW QUALITY PROTEIN: 3-oxo-5-alpha-steroid 4-dehydrogenase 2-like [Megaptera novaeangliae]
MAKINKDTEEVNNIISEVDLMDIHRELSSTDMGHSQKFDHIFGHKENIIKFHKRSSKTSRTFVYSMLTRGRPFPVVFLFRGFAFCMGNGLLQGYYLVYCAEYPAEWYRDIQFSLGVLFILLMGINHSDVIPQLRKPGEIIYRIPEGGLFMYISGANFLGEITEWIGYALATWSLPALAWAFFSLSFHGLRAFHHHRFYLKMFENHPMSRKALIPFIF